MNRHSITCGLLALVLSGCGGSSSGTLSPAAPVAGSATSPISQISGTSGAITLSANAATKTALPTVNGVAGTMTLPAGTGTITVMVSSGSTATAASARAKAAVGNLNIYYSITMTASQSLTLSGLPSFSFSLPSSISTAGQAFYYGFSNPTATTPGVSYTTQGPAAILGSSGLAFEATPGPFVFDGGTTYTFVFYSTQASAPGPELLYVTNGATVNVVPTSSTGTVASPQFTIPAFPNIVPAYTRSDFPHAPPSISVDANGNVYVPEGDAVAVFVPKSTAAAETLAIPQGVESVAVGVDGTVYVLGASQFTATTVYVFAPLAVTATSTITGGAGGALQPGFGSSFANRLIVDSQNHLYLANDVKSGHGQGVNDFDGVFDVQLNGNPPYNVTGAYNAPNQTVLPLNFGDNPLDIALSPDGHTLFIANDGVVEVWVGSSDGFRFSNYIGSDPGTTTEIGYESVTVDRAGNLYAKHFDLGAGSLVDVFGPPETTATTTPVRTFTLAFPADRIVAGP